jgi:hypothetical protein
MSKSARYSSQKSSVAMHGPPKRRPFAQSRRSWVLRLAEIERLLQSRWGNTLPGDKIGWDAFVFAAHTIAGRRGEIIKHIVAWAGLWAPWLPAERATVWARRIAANPLKFKADTAAWRLRVTRAERSALAIRTIGDIESNAEQRAAEKRIRQAEAARIRRSSQSSGKPRGRSTKNASSVGRKKILDITDDAFSGSTHPALPLTPHWAWQGGDQGSISLSPPPALLLLREARASDCPPGPMSAFGGSGRAARKEEVRV